LGSWRRFAAGIATLALASVPLALSSPAAQAADCNLSVPSSVRIAQYVQPISLRSNCTYAAAWGSQDQTDYVYFADFSVAPWVVYYDHRLGKVTWGPYYAYDADHNDLSQNQPITDVRLGSTAALYTSRSGQYVTLTAYASRFTSSTGQWIRWGKSFGYLQYYSSSHKWVTFKNAYPNASGVYSYRVHVPYGQSYRFVLSSISTVWGSTSGSSYR
jgi:hypothetical protein